MRTKRWGGIVVALLVGGLVPLLSPGPAAAAGPIDLYLADAGLTLPPVLGGASPGAVALLDHDNNLVVTVSPDRRRVEFRDPGAVFIGVPPCIGGLGVATCVNLDATLINEVRIGTGLGNDRIEIRAPATVRDLVNGADGNDTLLGGPGDSWLDGGPGNDVLRGAGGIDFLWGGHGADDIGGGPGMDFTSLTYESGPVSVTLDELANDGYPGEGDNVRNDVEDIDASVTSMNVPPAVDPPGGDTFVGDGGNTSYVTYNAPAALTGLGGNDTIRILGTGPGLSTIDGGDGNDDLSSVANVSILAGDGDDRVRTINGFVDQVDCGPGVDIAQVDPADVVVNCDTVLFA